MGKKKIIIAAAVTVVLLGLIAAGTHFVLNNAEEDPDIGAHPVNGTISAPGADGTGSDQASDQEPGQEPEGDGDAGNDPDVESPEETGEPEDDKPDIPLDPLMSEDWDIEDLPSGYDDDDEDEDEDYDDEETGADPSGIEAGIAPPSVEETGSGLTGQADVPVRTENGGTVSDGDASDDDSTETSGGNQAGGTEGGTNTAPQQEAQRVNGVPATFVKAVYSRNKKAVLVKLSLPEGKTIIDPSKYMIVAKADDAGHKPGKAVIYSCPSRSELIVYLNSAYAFGEHSAFAVIPSGTTGEIDVYADCYVELPYGGTYQASSVLDGSKADFGDMMRLMFDDESVVSTWKNTRSAHVLGGVNSLHGKIDGQSSLQLDAATAAGTAGTASNTNGTATGNTSDNANGAAGNTNSDTSGGTGSEAGTELGPDGGEGTSAAS